MKFSRWMFHGVLVLLAMLCLAPLVVMVLNACKPLSDIQSGGLLQWPRHWTLQPWARAWSSAQIGVSAQGLRPYFANSFLIVVPAVLVSTAVGALNGYVLTQYRLRGAELLYALLLFSVFIPFKIVLIPMARLLGALGLSGTIAGLVFVNVVYGIGFVTLFFRNYYAHFPRDLVRSARMDGAGFFGVLLRILLPNSGPIVVVTLIWQFTNIWNDFLFGSTFGNDATSPVTVALNNLVNSSMGFKEYNVYFAAAIVAAVPTLIVYVASGKYFVRGLMAGAVKG